MLERYLTPIFFSYVDKYVKNLAPSDLRLSLWQGEVALNNLELRLDVLESDLGLPMQLVSGKIRRLHIQVPWTALNSEPVRVTVDTLECVMKWKDDDSDSRSSHSLPGVPPQQANTPPPAPGYIQSWTNRIVNNVQITFNNVILKYVEEDIVLSVNIQEARIFAVGTDWQPSFSDASQPQDTLRKVLQVTDMTICLDKRDSSGRIPFYQEPLIYKSSFCTRILYNDKGKICDMSSLQSGMTYDIYWEKLDLSVSNFQFPLFVRILKRIVAIYYGCNIDGGGMPVYLPVLMDGDSSYQGSQVSGQGVSLEDDGQRGAGWMSWAWSVVAGKNEDMKQKSPFLTYGFYSSKVSFTYKLMEAASPNPLLIQQKFTFKPVLQLQMENLAMVTAMQGIHFFDFSFGVRSIRCVRLPTHSETIQTPSISQVTQNSSDEVVWLQCGAADESSLTGSCLHASLFADMSVGSSVDTVRSAYEKHDTQACSNLFAAVWIQYRYTVPYAPGGESSEGIGIVDSWLLDRKREATEQVAVIGDIQVVLTHAIKALLDDVITSGSKWNEHSENDSMPAEPAESIEQTLKRYSLSHYNLDLMRQLGVPMKTVQVTCKQLDIVLAGSAHERQLQEFLPNKRGPVLEIPQDQLPVYLHVSEIRCSMSIPIYPDQLKVDGPNPYRSLVSLPNSCFSVLLGEVSNIKVAFSPPHQPQELESLDCSSSILFCPQLHIKLRHSLLPPDWHQPGQLCNQQIVTIPSLSVEASGPQLTLAYGCYTAVVLGSDSMVLCNNGQEMGGHLCLHCKVSSVKWESSLWPDVASYSGSVHDIVLYVSTTDNVEAHVSYTPLVCGPIVTDKIYDGNLLGEKTRHDIAMARSDDAVLSFRSQIPIHVDNTVAAKQTAIPLFVVTVRGLAFNLDPLLYSWISSLIPTRSMGGDSTQENGVGGGASVDTGHSVEHSSYQHTSKLRPKIEADSGIHDGQARLLQWWPTVAKMNVNITILPLAIFMPTDNCPGLRSSDDIYCHDISAYYSALVSPSSAWPPLCPTLVACLPHITVVSTQFREEFKNPSFEPVSVVTDKSLKSATLPWSVTCGKFSLYTLHPTQSGAATVNGSGCNLLYLVEPGSLDVVIAPSSGVGRASELAAGGFALHLAKELTVCCHISVHSVSLSVSRKQIQVVKCVTQAVMNCIGQIVLVAAKPPSDSGIHSLRSIHVGSQHGYTQNVQHVPRSASEMRTFASTDVSSSHYTEAAITQRLKETAYSFWVQLTVPKLSLSVYHRLKASCIHEKGELIRVYAELEDTSASADFSDVCTSGRLNIGFIAMKHSKMNSDDNTWTNGLYSGLLLGSSKAPMFPQGHIAPVVPQSKSSISLGFRYVYGSVGTAVRKPHGLELKLTLLPLTVIPWLPALNTVMDAFDIAPQNQEVNKVDVSLHDSMLSPNEQPLQEKEPSFEIPQVHIDIDDIVLLLPVDEKVAGTDTDRVILFRLSLLSLKPRPQNPISRPILGIHETFFPKLEGYSCDEKQLQLNISTIEVWTGEWDDVASNVKSVAHEMLSDNTSSIGEQNPALEWNLAGRSQTGQSARLVPVLRDVTVQSVVAPALSSVVKMEDGPCKLTFGHSLEINLVSDLKITLNNKQILLFLHVLDELSSHFASMGSSDTKPAKPNNPAMPCEVLVTASKISFAIYSVMESSALPLLHAAVIQPSLRWSNMSNAVELKLNCYNFNVHAGQSDHPLNFEDPTVLDSPSSFPLAIITTRPGKRNSSGILPSLLYLTVNKPENGLVVVDCKLARPVFADIRLNLLVQALKFVQSIKTSLRAKINTAANNVNLPSVLADKNADRCVYPTVMISTLQMGLSLSSEGSSVCASLKSLSASFYGGSHSDTGHGGTASFDSLSVDIKHETHQVYLLLPVDITVNVEVTKVEGSNVSSMTTSFMKIGLSPVVVKLGTLHYHCFEAIKNNSTVCQLMSLMSGTKMQQDSNPVCQQDGIRWESEDDIRSGALEYVIQMSEVEKRPQPGQIVFTSGVGGVFPAMSWCYHEPRALSAIQALPLPISAANEVSLDPENDEIQCCLRYYDIAKQGYVDLMDFSLLQTEVLNAELPDTTVAAHEWQVVMVVSYDDNVSDATLDNVKGSWISPMVLAGCLKINSYFSTSLVPSLNVILEASCLEIKLMNYITNLGQLERDDSTFVFDGTLPWEHEVARVRMGDTQVHGKLWLGSVRQNAVIQMDSRLQVDYVDFSCLQWRPFVNPFDIHLHFIWKPVSPSITSSVSQSHRDERTVLSLNMESLVVNLSQTLLHTMGRLLLAWQRNDLSVAVAMNQYFICNGTIESLEFGQVNSAELITLTSGQCHAYCWKSISSHMMRVRFAADQAYNWSQAFSVEKESTLAIELQVENGKSVTMMAAVHRDGAIRTIIFTGSLQFVNGLLCALEVCVRTDRANSGDRILSLQGQKKALSIMENGTVDITVRQGLRHSVQADWSAPVQIQLSNPGKTGTIALPVRIDTNHVVDHHIAFCVLSVGDGQKKNSLQFVLLPICRIHSFFPDPVIIHLTGVNAQQQMQYVVPGMNQPFDVPFFDPTQSYKLSLQLSTSTPTSIETLPLSVSLTEQGNRQQTAKCDARTLIDSANRWPFLNTLTSAQKRKIMTTPAFPLPTFVEYGIPDKPLLAGVLSRVSYLGGCPLSAVVSLEPPALLTNCTNRIIVLHHSGLNQAQKVIPERSISLFCKIPFRLGLMEKAEGQDIYYWSETIDDLLPSRPVGRIVKPIVIVSGRKIFHLIMNECSQEDMLVLSVSDVVQICNMSNIPLTVASFIGHPEDVQSDLISCDYSYEIQQLPSSSAAFEPLRASSVCTAVHIDQDKDSHMSQKLRLPCLSFALSTCESELNQNKLWSLPIFLRRPALCRVSISVMHPFDNRLIPLALSFRTDDMGHMYMTVKNDPHPRLILTNHCSLVLKVAEALPARYRRTFPSTAVVEDIREQRLATLRICPSTSAAYECPTWATAYARTATVEHNSYLCFQSDEPGSDCRQSNWSKPLKLIPTDESIGLCNGETVRVIVEHIGTCLQVTMSSRNEQQQLWEPARTKLDTPRLLHITAAFDCLRINVLDEVPNQVDQHSKKQRDIVAVCIDSLRAHFMSDVSRLGDPVYNTEISVQSCQVDNLLEERRFDFPVVLYRQRQPATPSRHSKDPIPLVVVSVCLESRNGGLCLKSIQVTSQPLVVLLEDTLLYLLLETSQSLYRAALTSLSFPKLSSARGSECVSESSVFLLPCDIVSWPIVVEELDISSLSIFLSLRASLRLFLSSDHTPLNFENLQMRSVFTQSDVFQDALLNHYASGILSKAGWLIGSLELLGSPASLLMNVGAAFRDLILLPYEGLTRGPRSFVIGLGHGAASCVRHLSSGALSSVTGLASSISRNLERLSLDQEQEVLRTQPPQYLSTGVMQGLAALGLGVLGAVAGLVDEPLQSIGNINVSSPTESAKDVAASVGRGLVGAVTKPVVGAMELVSQAGQGLRNSVGLSEAPKRRDVHVVVPAAFTRVHWLQSEEETVLSLGCSIDSADKDSDIFQYAVLSRDSLSIYKAADAAPRTYSLQDIRLSEDTVHTHVIHVCQCQSVCGNWQTNETLLVTTKVERFLFSSTGEDQDSRENQLSSQCLCTLMVPNIADRHLLMSCMLALQDLSIDFR